MIAWAMMFPFVNRLPHYRGEFTLALSQIFESGKVVRLKAGERGENNQLDEGPPGH